jgi:hypothetical protein
MLGLREDLMLKKQQEESKEHSRTFNRYLLDKEALRKSYTKKNNEIEEEGKIKRKQLVEKIKEEARLEKANLMARRDVLSKSKFNLLII